MSCQIIVCKKQVPSCSCEPLSADKRASNPMPGSESHCAAGSFERVTVFLVLFFLFLCTSGLARGDSPPRIGWEESFDDISRWETALLNPVHGTPMPEIKSSDGCIEFRTPVGALNPNMRRDDWPEWPENPASSFTNWEVIYDDIVDIDKYPYIAARIREKSTFFYFRIR